MREKVALKCFGFMLILAFLFISSHQASVYAASEPAVPPLIITEIYPNTATHNELDEYLALSNPGVHTVNISGWSITDNEGTIIFPSFEVHQHQTLYVTRNASAFVTQMTALGRNDIYPDFEYGSDSDPAVSQMQLKGKALAFRNTGDEVILRDNSGRDVDVVIYGECSYEGTGWSGKALESPREGMILSRKGLEDTNQCEDWLILPFGSSYHAPERFAVSGEVTTFVSPDCSFSVLQREMDRASSSLYLNLYQLNRTWLFRNTIDLYKPIPLVLLW